MSGAVVLVSLLLLLCLTNGVHGSDDNVGQKFDVKMRYGQGTVRPTRPANKNLRRDMTEYLTARQNLMLSQNKIRLSTVNTFKQATDNPNVATVNIYSLDPAIRSRLRGAVGEKGRRLDSTNELEDNEENNNEDMNAPLESIKGNPNKAVLFNFMQGLVSQINQLIQKKISDIDDNISTLLAGSLESYNIDLKLTFQTTSTTTTVIDRTAASDYAVKSEEIDEVKGFAAGGDVDKENMVIEKLKRGLETK